MVFGVPVCSVRNPKGSEIAYMMCRMVDMVTNRLYRDIYGVVVIKCVAKCAMIKTYYFEVHISFLP